MRKVGLKAPTNEVSGPTADFSVINKPVVGDKVHGYTAIARDFVKMPSLTYFIGVVMRETRAKCLEHAQECVNQAGIIGNQDSRAGVMQAILASDIYPERILREATCTLIQNNGEEKIRPALNVIVKIKNDFTQEISHKGTTDIKELTWRRDHEYKSSATDHRKDIADNLLSVLDEEGKLLTLNNRTKKLLIEWILLKDQTHCGVS
jgi:hypothetical protein